MTGQPPFHVSLTRLLTYRKVDFAALSRAAAVAHREIEAVLDGAAPGPSLLRRLAPALGLHTADLFVVAGRTVPEDLAPLDAEAGAMVATLVGYAIRLPPERRHRLRRLVHSLPQQRRTTPVPPPKPHARYPPSAGAMVVRMLHNRNLNWVGSVQSLATLTPLYLSAATIGQVGHGRSALSPERLVALATLLAVPAGELAALTGVVLPADAPPVAPGAADVAELIWDVRRLTAAQVRQVRDRARSMLEP
ncbi:XRE family transcriptional regulator [Micromonospora sp. CPCC 205556]|uniref:XRE family transcriptional regulator n=1 Tax=Micromonospora sp. CPCC 205556 TaxID=3122398 RepID=UPI002FF3B813